MMRRSAISPSLLSARSVRSGAASASGRVRSPPCAPGGCAPYCQTSDEIANATSRSIHGLSTRIRQAAAGVRRCACQAMSPSTTRTGGKTSQLTLSQPPTLEELARRERGDRDRAEDQEVVRGLDLGPLLRPVAVGHERGRADEGEVPAEPEKDEGDPEMGDREAGEADRGGGGDQDEPGRGDALLAEAVDQPSGDEARAEHARARATGCRAPRVPTEWPHSTMASGAAVMTKLMRP